MTACNHFLLRPHKSHEGSPMFPKYMPCRYLEPLVDSVYRRLLAPVAGAALDQGIEGNYSLQGRLHDLNPM